MNREAGVGRTENVQYINGRVKEMALTGVITALFCICGPLTVPLPISPVPISLTNLAIYLALYILGMKRSIISYLLYLLIGFIGVPVFSGFTGGPAKLLGPTGGYLAGFILLVWIGGLVIDRWPSHMGLCLAGMLLGTAVCYLFGTFWLARQAAMSFSAAVAAGVIPFIPGDLCKMAVAMLFGPEVRKRLRRAKLD